MATRRDTAPDPLALDAARRARLHYVSDRRAGIQRRRAGASFVYRTDAGRRVGAADRARIRALAIPPAWTDVWICPNPDGHLQATGKDSKGRKQYRYHAQWHAVRTMSNFNSLTDFSRALPVIRRRVASDLRRPGLSREKVLAAAVSLMAQTHIRVGNAEYAEENRSFGLSTLRDRHMTVSGDHMQLRFMGKSGRFHDITLSHPSLARVVKRCQDLPGYELFQYLDDQGEVRDVSSDHINDYLREITGRDFTAKDFRTWAGTVSAAEFLCERSRSDARKPSQAGLIAAYDAAAATLRNTRAVCRKHYIHPAVGEAYLDGSLAGYFRDGDVRGSRTGLSPVEKSVVRLLKRRRA